MAYSRNRSLSLRRAGAALTLAFLLAGSPGARAGSTGTAGLYTPQGGDAGTGNGDYISAAGGMDAPYRYWIEVPPGLTRLVIEMFDADIGDGGTGEATAGRDRLRGSGFNTTVTYSLFAPDGTSRAPSFTTGNTTLPAGGDNAWLSFFDSTGDSYADNFGANSYSNNDGTFSWSTNWIETNDDNSAPKGTLTGLRMYWV